MFLLENGRTQINGESLKKEKDFSYIEVGEGTPIIVLHGLMGGLSNLILLKIFLVLRTINFNSELPIYTMSLLKTNVKVSLNICMILLNLRALAR